MKLIVCFVALCHMLGYSILGQHKIEFSFNQPSLLEADAGNDTTVASGSVLQLGGFPTARGGSLEYSYHWVPESLVNDPSIENPLIIAESIRTYSLIVMDGKGCTAEDDINVYISPPVELQKQISTENIVISPNPANDHLFIAIQKVDLNCDVNIYVLTTSGEIIHRQSNSLFPSVNSHLEIPLTEIPVGFYLLRIVGENVDATMPFIKN